MAPGYTDYRKRVQYQTYDVTDILKAENKISIVAADGWAVGRFGWYDHEKVFDSVFLALKRGKVHTAGEGKSPIHKKEKIIYRGWTF